MDRANFPLPQNFPRSVRSAGLVVFTVCSWLNWFSGSFLEVPYKGLLRPIAAGVQENWFSSCGTHEMTEIAPKGVNQMCCKHLLQKCLSIVFAEPRSC